MCRKGTVYGRVPIDTLNWTLTYTCNWSISRPILIWHSINNFDTWLTPDCKLMYSWLSTDSYVSSGTQKRVCKSLSTLNWDVDQVLIRGGWWTLNQGCLLYNTWSHDFCLSFFPYMNTAITSCTFRCEFHGHRLKTIKCLNYSLAVSQISILVSLLMWNYSRSQCMAFADCWLQMSYAI